ncbi:H-NS family nucleoid-associated regulatory protein [Paraburkholderia bryophila]|uniref:DNA-binding protein H-NS n=1 Tax=Paraburkholderia bryophila TaxID=420952 RepID=A0A7Y9WDS6_9BURK|nr:H-NS family nucleoid-associated regulatory protein [Paraburkholderia bryophila]NYH18857.1 DNA-binding protein H-NS [Paraburkholderia bryophila]
MATLEQIQARVKKLQAQAEALLTKKTQAAVDQIRKLMLEHGLTTEDIEAKAKARRPAKGLKVSAAGMAKTTAADKAKAAPKYLNPETGATWSGRGRAPAWIAEAKDRRKFLIAGGAKATVATPAGAVSKANTAAKKAAKAVDATSGKGQRKGPQPTLYRDPKSGKTWSGRGPAPAWLSGAKDRTRFLIDGAGAEVAVAKTSKPKAAAKKTVAKKVPVAKKAPVAKKVVASKKAPAKKTPVKKAVASRNVATQVDADFVAPGITVTEAGA